MQRYWQGLLGTILATLVMVPNAATALAPHYLCSEKRTLRDTLLNRWAPYEFPIKVYLPAPPADWVPHPEVQMRAVEEAFRRWFRAWPYLQFRFVNRREPDGIHVVWYNQIFVNQQGRWGEAYPPVVMRAPDKRVLHWSDIHLSVRAHVGSAVGSVTPVLLSEREIRDLAIHEIGHALGLNHSDDGNDVMGGGNLFLATEFDMRNISPRDVATVKYLYSLPYTLKQNPCEASGPP